MTGTAVAPAADPGAAATAPTTGTAVASAAAGAAIAPAAGAGDSIAVHAAKVKGCAIPPRACGRGQTLQTIPQWSNWQPPKKGREGEHNPNFFGASLKHCQWFKQLRRIQALLRMRKSGSTAPMHHLKCVEVWQAIREAPGFNGGFCQWWTSVQSSLVYLSCFIPSVEELQDLHDQFHAQVRVFEAQLSQTRLHEAKQSRILDPNRIFRDCAEEAPAKLK